MTHRCGASANRWAAHGLISRSASPAPPFSRRATPPPAAANSEEPQYAWADADTHPPPPPHPSAPTMQLTTMAAHCTSRITGIRATCPLVPRDPPLRGCCAICVSICVYSSMCSPSGWARPYVDPPHLYVPADPPRSSRPPTQPTTRSAPRSCCCRG